MSYDCKIVADSIAENGVRLTTFEITYPLIIHAEIMTHRVFSRNVASNRAIPVDKMIASVNDNPFIPERFPVNKAGMQNESWLEGFDAKEAERLWAEASKYAIGYARALQSVNVHKQITNRLLAPFLWTTAVITATEWNNFWGLRCHEMAQDQIQTIAYMMRDMYNESEPRRVSDGNWHLPYITDDDRIWALQNVPEDPLKALIYISMGRCARISYLRQNALNEQAKDIEVCEGLILNRHMSPTEHVATPETIEDYYGNDIIPALAIDWEPKFYGNFRGWKQYRKFLPNESGE
jgi:thymidylate synthase ThyX